MKILLYTENFKRVKNSGLGRAIEHQMTALTNEGIEYTTNLKDDYDIDVILCAYSWQEMVEAEKVFGKYK